NARINKEYNKAGINLDKQLPGESRELKDYIDKTLSSGDESTITSLINNTLVDGELTVDQKKSIIEYALASDARQQKNTDKKTRSDTAARNIIKEVDSNLNETSGTLMTVTLGTGINATQVQVIKGIVPNEDGTINRELSESEFYYRDENGETQVAPIEMAGNVTENIPRDEAVKQIATPVIESIVADEENENALASQDFQPGDMVYYIDPASGMAAGIQLQGISENGKYIGINDSGAQQEVEPRLVQSEQDFLSSMRDEEIETAIDNLNQSLTSGALNGNLSDRMIDLRSKLETELQQRSQKSSKTLNTSPSQQPPSRDLQQTGRDILSELNRISSDIHSTAGNAIIDGTWDGDFRGAGTSTLEIDNEGNVVLRRGASDMQHLIKEGESVSGRQELYDTSLTNGGGKGVPTASNSQVGDGYTYSDREITGIFRIPINDFLELARKGEIILGNTGEQEIVISPSVAKKYLSETKSKTETEAQEAQTEATPEDLIRQMEENALEAPQLELTPENWEAEFGEDGKVKTPVGEVKMGDNQYRKIIKAGRQKEFGMIKPTLTNPDVVIEVPSEAIEGQTTERPSSYLFVKTFKYGEERIKFFTSVTVSKDGLEVVVSNHIENLPRMRGFIRNGKLLYQRPDMVPGAEASSPASTGQSTEADNTAGTSVDKDNTENPQMQANAPENSQTEAKPDPFINFPRNKKGEIDVENLTAEQQLQYAESAAGEQFAIEQAARSIRGLEKKRASLEEKLERETNMAKAANIQKEIENINKSIGFYKEYREARNQQNDLAARQQAFEESKTNSNTPESTADTPPADTPTPFHQTTEKPNPIPETKLKPLIERLKQTGLAKEVITDKARMREYLEKYFGKEGAERLMRALNGSVKNKDRKILRTDENGRQIAWENDSYFISLSHGDKQHYSVALWDKSNGAKVGELYGTLDNKDVPKGYISVENVKIDARHRGQGLSVEMYQALIDFSDEDVKGISSYLPDRINKVQVPRIWKKFGGMTEGDYDNIRFMSTPKGEVYGFVTPEGEIYLDPDKMNANTPIHEFGHLWNSFVEKNNPELWEKGIELAKQSDLFVRAKNNPASFGLKENATDREIADEVLARLYGNRGESTFHEKGLGEKLQAWLNEVLEWIGSKLGIRNLTPDQIQNLTLEQFVDGATADILSGKPIPIPQSPKSLETSKTSDTRYQFTGEKGAANLDKTEEATTRMDNLDVAREMETAGKEAKAIKFATGWERGADGKWRYEIPDFKVSDIKTWGDGNFVGQLEDLVADADFLKAYPELKGVKVNVLDLDFWDRQDEVSNGEYDPRKKEITVKYHKNDPNSAGIMHEILVHEIQHAVQNQEGFAKGSSPISFKDNLSEIVNRIEEITGVKLSGRVEDFERELSKYEGDNRLAAPIAVHGKELDELAIKYGYADRFGLFENLENESS
ncbi:MAG: hypothetical protein LBM08_14020, partial [Dysgonamonadaceae bacterium]|nr:hypothetical protein [Dysgonamonadaceae bacterium]